MRLIEHLLVVILSVATVILALELRDARQPHARPPKEAEALRSPASPQLTTTMPEMGTEPAQSSTGGPGGGQPDQALAGAEQRASELARDSRETSDPLARLERKAAVLVASGGADALYRERLSNRRRAPSDGTLRAWVQRFARETNPEVLWSLAQLIRFDDHLHWGTIWSHDEESLNGMLKQARRAADPFKRYLALDALGMQAGNVEDLLLRDDDRRVRAKAASLMPSLVGRCASEAEPLRRSVNELVGSNHPAVRELAAAGLARWAFQETARATLVNMARNDSDTGVRAASARALTGADAPDTRALFVELLGDARTPRVIRDAAQMALAALPALSDEARERIRESSAR